ncbi:MAG: class I SAM-dependent methyltransferase [Spirochaetaceae bacterium]|jgi:2-polyprenyl-3-methyl-5-hydroxy-6-metoxy-1,4-benzoquinol methylase|nr:class I SAM-dependent methyltransferase [Spirochaetaceae bacterium]
MEVKTWSTPAKAEDCRSIPCPLCGYAGTFTKALDCSSWFYVRCPRCGLVHINPQPLVQEIHNRYAGNSYLNYEKANEDNFLNLQHLGLRDGGFYDIFSDGKGGLKRGLSLLDIGCATGALVGELAALGWEASGLELSAEEAAWGRSLGRNILEGTIEGALADGRLGPAQFDVVLASHVIEHLNQPALFVQNVYQIVKPGGYFFITTPNIDGFQAKLFGKKWRSAIFDHICLFSKANLRKILENTGWTIEKTATWGGLAKGTAPDWLKKMADNGAKRFGFGDVVLMRCKKN